MIWSRSNSSSRRALAADDLERVGQPRHRELGFARVGRVGEARVPRPFRGKRRVGGGVEHVEKEWLVRRRPAATPAAARAGPCGCVSGTPPR